MSNLFPNPESVWHAEQNIRLELEITDHDRQAWSAGSLNDENKKRILNWLPKANVARYLTGGLSSTNVLVDSDHVLRFCKQPTIESKLMGHPWHCFRVPRIDDEFDPNGLLVEFVPHTPLENTEAHGSAAGSALAEIHGIRFDACGKLNPETPLRSNTINVVGESWGCFPTMIAEYLESHLEVAQIPTSLLANCIRWFDEAKAELDDTCTRPSLLHGDFKASNLHWAGNDKLLVLDWEFAYAGPTLMDVGQLFRWGASPEFETSFVRAYRDGGQLLPNDWKKKARIADLVNLVGLLAKSSLGSRRQQDCIDRIKLTIGDQQSDG